MRLLLVVLLFTFSSTSFAHLQPQTLKHSVSVQMGLNGAMSNISSFGFQAFPPDLSYAYKLFDNNRYALSTSTFYDNIGVNTDNINFDYRLGQRLDFGYELSHGIVYGTVGLAHMFIQGAPNALSCIYGFGITREISSQWSLVSELNFQDINKYNIVNLSVGIIYAFNI